MQKRGGRGSRAGALLLLVRSARLGFGHADARNRAASSARRDTRTQGLSLRRGPSGAGTVRRTCRLARRVGRFHPRSSPFFQASSNGAVGVPLSGLARLVLWFDVVAWLSGGAFGCWLVADLS